MILDNNTLQDWAMLLDNIQDVIHQFAHLFKQPTTLPPLRSIDHKIYVVNEEKLVHIKPYSYPHFLKLKFEKLIKEILYLRVIRTITSFFSSLVILVKKKIWHVVILY